MPRKNSIKRYYENGYYHIYNRGVEKRNIFLDRADNLVFLHLLKTALSPAPKRGSTPIETDHKQYKRMNFHDSINLLAYCLMTNHFHLLVRQAQSHGISEFIRSICTSYSMYFNKKYKRVGSLFQGIFKAIDIEEENYLLWVSRYIHRNPSNFRDYPYSSYQDYVGIRQTSWLETETIFSYFSTSLLRKYQSYQQFIDGDTEDPVDLSYVILDENDED